MTDQDWFLRALAENEDDTNTRLIYSDWLEEHGEYEEADRQRKWPAAKQWLLRLCEEEVSYYGSAPFRFSYEELIAFGHRVVTERKSSTVVHLRNGAIDAIGKAIPGDRRDLFRNWSIVTGIPLPADLEDKTFYWECCFWSRFRIAMNGETADVTGGVSDELLCVAVAYHQYVQDHGVSPHELAHLEAMRENFPQVHEMIQSGLFVVRWDARLTGDGAENDKYVLGYESKTPSDGGWVLLGGGSWREVSANEFQALPLIPVR